MATKDYSQYNLVKPVLKPTNMTLAEVEKALGMASKQFFMHKFENIEQLTPWKQEFMLSVFDILMNYSYLAGEMRGMASGAKMPDSVRNMLKKMKTAKRELVAQPLAPIP